MDYLSTETHLNIDMGKVISLNRINKILFGNKDPFCVIDKITLLNSGIVKQYQNDYYLIINKLTNYFDLVKSKNMLFFPYNYYKSFTDIDEYSKYSSIIKTIDEYLEYVDTIGDQFSYLIKHILKNNTFLNAEYVEDKNGICAIKFEKKSGKALHIFLTNTHDMNGLLSYAANRDPSQYEKLYNTHKQILLMEDPEEFLICNLEKVTGDLDFSRMAVKSYLIKNDFQTPLKGLCNLISWKNEELMTQYIDFFVFKYNSLVKINDGEYMTNFEGLNKFLLNLEVKYLQQWENKEQINELYYQITHELIKSYEILYKNK